MTHLEGLLSDLLATAFTAIAGSPTDPVMQRSAHADYQANGALSLARRLGRSPREVAAEVLSIVDLSGLATAEVSGPGFINLTVLPETLDRLVEEMAMDSRLGVPITDAPETVIVDYSGPNVAKEMHVGHLRSTIIGDCLVRILRWAGHEVKSISHIGDWGTPFGMLLERLIEIGETAAANELSMGDLDGFYKAARQRFDEDPEFADRARQRVVALQSGDEELLRLWRILVAESEKYFLKINDRLEVTLSKEDFVGESSYNDQLRDVVGELDRLGLLHKSNGADCVFPPGFTGRDGEPFPLIVRKHDGGYGYPATDLAAIRYRIKDLKGTRLLYVIGAPQHRHLEMVFAVARQAGWMTGSVRAQHVAFGSILGEDGKMLRSRAGKSVKLIELLDEAVARASTLVSDSDVAAAVGIGAIKYADLSSGMAKDYVFDLDRMLTFTGDTGVYLQYAHARIRSIIRSGLASTKVRLAHPAERTLALQLLSFPTAIDAAVDSLEPHKLAGYLRELAVAFTAFYESCRVIQAEPQVRESRLALCDLTGRVLAKGLELLGIQAPERL